MFATASPHNFDLAKKCGATHVLSYNFPAVNLNNDIEAAGLEGQVDLVLNYISSRDGSIEPIGTMLAVIAKDADKTAKPEYVMDVAEVVDGLEVNKVTAQFYLM
ncbi:MAG: hypothetical protein Q9192_003910 [Flavoplaca navasiana]